MMLKVLELFDSIDGEGRRAGELTTFIRLSVCNLRCSWCDTAYSQTGLQGDYYTIDDIIKKVESFGNKNVTVTGGEPLIHSDISSLFVELVNRGFDVNVETNGSIDITHFIISDNNSLWFTMDYKPVSSGMNSHMKLDRFLSLRPCDVLKFVVGSTSELNDALAVIQHIRKNNVKCLVYISPVFGLIQPAEIVKFMQHNKSDMHNVRVQLQLHKIIWDPNMRCV